MNKDISKGANDFEKRKCLYDVFQNPKTGRILFIFDGISSVTVSDEVLKGE